MFRSCWWININPLRISEAVSKYKMLDIPLIPPFTRLQRILAAVQGTLYNIPLNSIMALTGTGHIHDFLYRYDFALQRYVFFLWDLALNQQNSSYIF